MQANLINYPRRRIYHAGEWSILLLDSSKEGQPGGHFSDAELAFAEQSLKELTGRPLLVAMHHSPVMVNSTWLDQPANRQPCIDLHQMLVEPGPG